MSNESQILTQPNMPKEINRKRLDCLKKETVFGYVKFKFKENQVGARYKLNHIPELEL